VDTASTIESFHSGRRRPRLQSSAPEPHPSATPRAEEAFRESCRGPEKGKESRTKAAVLRKLFILALTTGRHLSFNHVRIASRPAATDNLEVTVIKDDDREGAKPLSAPDPLEHTAKLLGSPQQLRPELPDSWRLTKSLFGEVRDGVYIRLSSTC
jgi:hypothetical protein